VVVNANGVDLWVEQEGEGDDVLFISGLADEGACWMWAAERAEGIRDFLVAVNLWCFAPRIWNEGIMDGWLAAAEASPHAQSVDAFCRSAHTLLHHDTADRIGQLAVPTLVTVGELDLVLPPRFSREIADRIPGARLVVVPGAGHQPFQELPEDYNRLLVGFWGAVA